MATSSSDSREYDLDAIVQQVAAEFVHHLYPSFRTPAYLACPDDACAQAVLRAVGPVSAANGVPMEVIDLRPAPAERLSGVTARLAGIDGVRHRLEAPPIRLLVLEGFDRMEGPDNDAPTYPFRSWFQFDQDHLWLFLGRDWHRLSRLFVRYRLPLYHAATDLTPARWAPWRAFMAPERHGS